MSNSCLTTQGKKIEIEKCGGASSCVGITEAAERLAADLARLADELDPAGPVPEGAGHRRPFRISLSGCANGCTRPQIADIGIIGAVAVRVDRDCCTGCGACVAACREKAIDLDGQTVTINEMKCVFCGECLTACPFDAIRPAATGFRILLGGRLGRHPRLGIELPGFRSERQVADIVRRAYRELASAPGLRLGDIIEERGTGWVE